MNDFVSNIILSCFFLFFLFIELYVSIPAVITQIFNSIADIVIPIGIPTKETKSDMETHPVIPETTISGVIDIIQNSANFYIILTYQFTSIYFFI